VNGETTILPLKSPLRGHAQHRSPQRAGAIAELLDGTHQTMDRRRVAGDAPTVCRDRGVRRLALLAMIGVHSVLPTRRVTHAETALHGARSTAAGIARLVRLRACGQSSSASSWVYGSIAIGRIIQSMPSHPAA
jgi:hypothetical protein